MSISQRIKEICDFEGSQSKFAAKTGLKTQTVSRMVSDGAGLRSDTLLIIHKAYPKLNIHWLITGEGKVWAENAGEESGPYETEEDMAKKLLHLMERRIKELEREIKRIDPDAADMLGIEE